MGEKVDPENLDLETRLNGEVRQRYNTQEMIYSFPEIVELLSRDFTFLPGDVGGDSYREFVSVRSQVLNQSPALRDC